MSDENVMESTETPAETTETVETPVEETTTADEHGGEEGSEEEGTEEKAEAKEEPKKTNRLERRFKDLTGKLKAREAAINYWQEALSEVTGQEPPRRDAYGSAEDYLHAVEDYRDKIRTPKVMLERAEADARKISSETESVRAETWEQKLVDFSKELPNYAQVMAGAAQTPLHPELQRAIMDSEIGPALAYHLANNTEYAYDLAELPLRSQLLELGKLESQLQARRNVVQAKTKTNVLPPIESPRVQGKASVPRKSPGQMGLEEYATWRANGGGTRR